MQFTNYLTPLSYQPPYYKSPENLANDTALTKDLDSHTDYDKGHGRIETRECCVLKDLGWLKKRHLKWKTINCIIRIKSTTELKKGQMSRNPILRLISKEPNSCRNPQGNTQSLACRK